MQLRFHPLTPKIVGSLVALLALVAVVGTAIASRGGYGAAASELLPNFSSRTQSPTASGNDAQQQPRLRHFGMSLVNGRSAEPMLSDYQLFELAIMADGSSVKATLALQKLGDDQPTQRYERTISEEQFMALWPRLQALEVAQLTNLSPYTEDLENATRLLRDRTNESDTYSFYFKDGVYDYPNSFEVYAPESLKDTRYQDLKLVSLGFAAVTFGDVLASR